MPDVDVSGQSSAELERLMLRYQLADRAAAARLIELVSPQLYRYFAAQVEDAAEADALLQSAWLRIHRARHTYRPGEPLLPWIYAIAGCVQSDSRLRPVMLEAAGVQVEGPLDPGQAPAFERIAARLPRSQRVVLILLQVIGFSAQDVARATSSTAGSVKRQAHRAFEHLRGVPPFLNLTVAQRQLSVACREMDDVINLYGPGSELTSQAREHLAECDRCRQLVRTLEQIPLLPLPSGEQLKRIQSVLLEDLKPVPPLPSVSTFVLGFALIFVAVWILGLLLTGQGGWNSLATSQQLFVFVPLLASAGLLVFSLTGQMTPAGKHVSSTAVLSACSFLLLVPVLALLFRSRPGLGFVTSGLVCLRIGMSFAVPAAFLFGLLLRRGVMLSPGLTGATAGGLAGLVGLAVLEVRCSNLGQYHILVWHLSVTLLSALAGLASGAVAASIGHRRARL